MLSDLKDYTVGFRYLYQIPASVLPKLPKWAPLSSEVPLPPHKASKIAAGHLKTAIPAAKHLTIVSVLLERCGVGLDFEQPALEEIWAYQISFKADPPLEPRDQALLNVMILLDGSIVVPAISRLK